MSKVKNLLLSSVIAAVASFATAAQADIFVAGNSAAGGSGPISTFDFTTGLPQGSFIPTGAVSCAGGACNGRGVALTLNNYYYTELGGGFGPTDMIRIAPYNNGAGGPDSGSFDHPAPTQGIQ